jgi:hypothetical protein
MKSISTVKKVAASALTIWAGSAFAHEDHGMSGAHWHATDVWGFVALGGVVALGIWLSRGGK